MQISQAIFLAAPEFVQNQQTSNFVQDVFSAFNYFEQLCYLNTLSLRLLYFEKMATRDLGKFYAITAH